MAGWSMLAIFVGGGVGSTCRYAVGRFVGARYRGALPAGTILINVTGCFAIGLLSSALAALQRDVALETALLSTGFLGGYTTFSTYTLEGWLRLRDGRLCLSLASLLGPVAAGLSAAALGAAIVRAL